MKTTLSLILLTLALSAQAQSVTNMTVTCVLQLSNGLNYTNSVSSSNTNIFAAATNAMVALNYLRANSVPVKPATTNLAHYFIEFTKLQFSIYTADYDAKMVQDVGALASVMTQADKDAIRAINAKY